MLFQELLAQVDCPAPLVHREIPVIPVRRVSLEDPVPQERAAPPELLGPQVDLVRMAVKAIVAHVRNASSLRP